MISKAFRMSMKPPLTHSPTESFSPRGRPRKAPPHRPPPLMVRRFVAASRFVSFPAISHDKNGFDARTTTLILTTTSVKKHSFVHFSTLPDVFVNYRLLVYPVAPCATTLVRSTINIMIRFNMRPYLFQHKPHYITILYHESSFLNGFNRLNATRS
jgi:hypothetical protein